MLTSTTLRTVSLYATHFLVFSTGVENGVFLPSVVEYLHTLGVQHEAVFGMVLASYWLSCCLSCKSLQFLVAASYNVQLLLLLCCILYIFGGFTYFLAPSLWAITFSKIFAGLGSGVLCAIETDLAPNTSAAEFSSLSRSLRLSLAFGWACSPLFCAVSELASRTSSLSEPGVVVGSLFVGCALLTILGFTNLARNLRHCRLRDTLALAYERRSSAPKNYGATKINDTDLSIESNVSSESCSIIFSKEKLPASNASAASKCSEQTCSVQCQKKSQLTQSDELLEAAEELMGSRTRLPPFRGDRIHFAEFSKSSFSPMSMSSPRENCMKNGDVVNLTFQDQPINKKELSPCCQQNRPNWLCPQFLTGFLFGSLQTMLTPLTGCYFQYTPIKNAFALLTLSIFGLLPLFLVTVQATLYRYIVALGCSLGVLATTGLLIIGPGSTENAQVFAACILALGVSCGILLTTCGDHSRDQFRLSENQECWLWCLGLVVGPLWTGSTVGQPKIMHSGHLFILILGLANTFVF